VLKKVLKEFSYEMYGKNVEYLDKGSDIIPCACKHVLVQAKARSICEDLLKGVGNVKPFSASIGGFSRFTKRDNFCNIKMTGAADSADSVVVIQCTGQGCQFP